MAATVATVAYLGLEARAVEVQVQLSSGLPQFTIVGLPDKAVAREPRAGARRARGDRSRASAQGHHRQPLARRPAQGRLALRSADRARACWRRSARPTPRRCRTMSRSASCASTGGSPPRPGVLLAAIHASSHGQGPDLPGRAGQRGGLGGRARRHRRARPARACSPTSRAPRSCRRRPRPRPSRPTAGPTSRR